jgi:hypothetical protein
LNLLIDLGSILNFFVIPLGEKVEIIDRAAPGRHSNILNNHNHHYKLEFQIQNRKDEPKQPQGEVPRQENLRSNLAQKHTCCFPGTTFGEKVSE